MPQNASVAEHLPVSRPEVGRQSLDIVIDELHQQAPREWRAVIETACHYLDARGIDDATTRDHLIRDACLAAARRQDACNGPALTARVLALIDRELATEASTQRLPVCRDETAPAPAAVGNTAVAHCPAVYGRRLMRPQRLDYPQLIPASARGALKRLAATLSVGTTAVPAPAKRS